MQRNEFENAYNMDAYISFFMIYFWYDEEGRASDLALVDIYHVIQVV